MKSGKMRGFMCQSAATAANCMAADPGHLVVLPRRAAAADRNRIFLDSTTTRLINNGKYYSRLPRESRRLVRATATTTSSAATTNTNTNTNTAATASAPAAAAAFSSTSGHIYQVVVMRVSLHCKGCAGKVKKHLSKMEGVTSFSIDLESKRVTVMGHVSPVGVLESISKVRRAEFWPC